MSETPTITITTDECVYQQFGDVSTQAILPRCFTRAWLQAQHHRKMMQIHSPKDTNKEEKQ